MPSRVNFQETDDGIIINSDWCYYLVAYLDVLGQKEISSKICNVKPGDIIDDEINREISENLFFLENSFRDELRKTFQALTSEKQSQITVNSAFQGQFNQMRRAEIYFQFFSDSLIVYVPLKFESYYTVPVNSIWGVLGACCQAMLSSLAVGHTVRGGIDVGLATRLESGEVYGPALNKAYLLESKIADNPRIVIGEGVWGFLKSLSDKKRQHPSQSQLDIDGCKRIADLCLKLISYDTDGKRILDYLGSGFLELQNPFSGFYKIYENSKNFIFKSLAKYSREENSELTGKYRYLAGYFQDRSAAIEKVRIANPL
jgi:hypothetical protein